MLPLATCPQVESTEGLSVGQVIRLYALAASPPGGGNSTVPDEPLDPIQEAAVPPGASSASAAPNKAAGGANKAAGGPNKAATSPTNSTGRPGRIPGSHSATPRPTRGPGADRSATPRPARVPASGAAPAAAPAGDWAAAWDGGERVPSTGVVGGIRDEDWEARDFPREILPLTPSLQRQMVLARQSLAAETKQQGGGGVSSAAAPGTLDAVSGRLHWAAWLAVLPPAGARGAHHAEIAHH